jgi:uncharacterized protein (DUF488 family)
MRRADRDDPGQGLLWSSEQRDEGVRPADFEPLRLWTIGHSTRSLEEFLSLLREHRIEGVIDVRRFPASRRYPHFNRPALEAELTIAGMTYLWLPDLGGRRSPTKDSINTGLRSLAFRGYADYMETDAFRSGIERLKTAARSKPAAIMCAEAVWWRCHRSLIADYLKAEGAEVIHIVSSNSSTAHPYTPAARIIAGHLNYSGT